MTEKETIIEKMGCWTERDGIRYPIFMRHVWNEKYPINDIYEYWGGCFHGLFSARQFTWTKIPEVLQYCREEFNQFVERYPKYEFLPEIQYFFNLTLMDNTVNMEVKEFVSKLQQTYWFIFRFLSMAGALQQIHVMDILRNDLWGKQN